MTWSPGRAADGCAAPGPTLRLPAGWRVLRGDRLLVRGQRGESYDLRYFIGPSVVQEPRLREREEAALNGYFDGSLYVTTDGVTFSTDCARLCELLRGDVRHFVRTVYRLRDSTAWGDGADEGGRDVLADECMQPDGLEWLDVSVRQELAQPDGNSPRLSSLVSLAASPRADNLRTFRAAVALLENHDSIWAAWLALAGAAGLARLGHVDKATDTFVRVEASPTVSDGTRDIAGELRLRATDLAELSPHEALTYLDELFELP
jgi:hypothetical protein